MTALNSSVGVHYHVITEIVEAHFIVCTEGDICGVCFLSLCGSLFVNNKTDLKTHKAVDFTHPLGVTLCKVIVYRNDMNAFACESVKISREGSNESLTFTGLHFCDTTLVKNNTAENLYGIVLHTENTPCRLTASRKCFGENIVECSTFLKTLLELNSLVLELLVCKL